MPLVIEVGANSESQLLGAKNHTVVLPASEVRLRRGKRFESLRLAWMQTRTEGADDGQNGDGREWQSVGWAGRQAGRQAGGRSLLIYSFPGSIPKCSGAR